MNNLTEPIDRLDDRTSRNLSAANSSWLSKLYSLPISRKTNLIPWFSFGGLLVVLSLGGTILYGSLTERLSKQARSQLTVKSEVIDLLLNDRNRLTDSLLDKTVSALTQEQSYSAVYLYQNNGELALVAAENVGVKISPDIGLLDEKIIELAIADSGGIVEQKVKIDRTEYIMTATTIADSTGKPRGVLVHGSSFNSVYDVIKSSILAQSVLSIIALILIIYLSKILGKAIAEPIQTLQKVAQKFSEGNFKVRAQISSSDEVGLLATTFNILADSIEINESRLRQDAERSRILKEIALNISEAETVSEIMQIAVDRSKNVLNADRIIYCSFNSDDRGKVVAEAMDNNKFPSTLNAGLVDPDFIEQNIDRLNWGETIAISNIYQAGLDDSYLKVLEQFATIASLIAPVIVGDKLMGLLIAHQCSESRAWQQDEIELLSQVATQTGTAIEKVELVEIQRRAERQERQAKENLQRRALELLMEVDPVSRGDLTVRVKVQEDEIGTIGDSYNTTIESLRKLVAQVQTAAIQVSSTTSDKDTSIQELSTDALAQTQEINNALARIKGITNSIQAVATNAKSAEAAVLRAAQTVKAGDDAMNQTVEGFQEIRNTVAETAKKVKRLGESSQKISKVVNVISNFADQTNLLALNASIEAAHAGEEGRGFAVVADEVRSLARQSADATAEIEALVAEIQAETNEVVAAMESGTEQVVTGTKLVDRTRNSLIEIADVSQEIDRLVAEIATATVEQSQDSEVVTQTMIQVAAISDKTASEAEEVSASFKDLLIVAQELQSSVAKFKVS